MRVTRTLLIAGAALLVQACATTQKGLDLPEITDWEIRQEVLVGVDRWQFRGRVGVKAGDEGFTGKLTYGQDNDEFQATISGPLGIGTVKLSGEGESVTLTNNKGEITKLRDAEQDLRNLYGWTIPVASLRFWALGIPDPSTEAITVFDDEGLLSSMQQRGWTVTIGEYRDGGGQRMPSRVTAVNDDARVRLLIDDWTFF
jgi:outer membrane lipoprotein LolB